MSDPTIRRPFGPYCKHLSSKKLLVTQAIPHEERDVLDRSQHCWCSQTQTILGPDRYVAHPETCQDDRTCFRSRGEAIL